MSALSCLLTGKAKVTSAKSSSQLKCLNEKRRRDQENIYIEELAELISASISDMSQFSTVKPDKCAILKEAVNQIRQIKQQEESDAAVQQSHVSSSKPNILANDVLGPLLLEALDGFLFVVNNQGKVEFVSDNIGQYLGYTPEDLVGKSIYNIIHIGDHAQYSSNLLPRSLQIIPGSGLTDASNKGRTFNCRMLQKSPPADSSEEGESNGGSAAGGTGTGGVSATTPQLHSSQYELMQISAVLQPYPVDRDCESHDDTFIENQSCLVCIARRLPITEKSNMLGIDQFTTKQDLTGKIVACDTSGVSNHYKYPNFIDQNILEFCHVNDNQLLTKHHQEVLKNGSNTSGIYRFKLQGNRFVFVQTKSKLFNNQMTSEPEFIMSTHSIIRECDNDLELKGSASTSLMKSIIYRSQHRQQPRQTPSTSACPPGNGLLPNTIGGASISASATLKLGKDDLNINDVLDMLPKSSSSGCWDTFLSGEMFGLTKATSSGGSSAITTNAMPSAAALSQMTWSNQLLKGQQSIGRNASSTVSQHRPLALNIQGRGSISPGFQNQRSPGYVSAGQHSPAYSPSPSVAARSPGGCASTGPQRSPAAFNQPQWSPGFATNQRSPASAMGQGQMRNMVYQQQTSNPTSTTQIIPQIPRKPAASPAPVSRVSSFTSDDGVYVEQVMSSQMAGSSMNAKISNMAAMLQQQQQQLQQQVVNKQQQPMMGLSAGMAMRVGSNVQNPLQALQTMEAQAGGRLSQATREQIRQIYQKGMPMPQSINNRMKLRQLLSRENKELEKTADASQSPVCLPSPGPTKSPQQLPTTTTMTTPDDADDISHVSTRSEGNEILKQLLSQDDDSEERSKSRRASVDESATTSRRSSDSTNDKNEAEPKKNENLLLKQLLNDDSKPEQTVAATMTTAKESKKKKCKNELLQKLLLDDEDDQRANSVESTTAMSDESGSKMNHSKIIDSSIPTPHSSTKNRTVSVTSVDSLGLNNWSQQVPMSSGNIQQQQQQTGLMGELDKLLNNSNNASQLTNDKVLQLLGNSSPESFLATLYERENNQNATAMGMSSVGGGTTGGLYGAPAALVSTSSNVNLLNSGGGLVNIGSMSNQMPSGFISGIQSGASKTLKRKASTQSVDSTGGATGSDMDAHQQQQHQSQLVQNNQLLTQLLSKKVARENQASQQSITVQPTGIPQDKLTMKLERTPSETMLENLIAESKSMLNESVGHGLWDSSAPPQSPYMVKDDKTAKVRGKSSSVRGVAVSSSPATSTSSAAITYENLQQLLASAPTNSSQTDDDSGGAGGSSSSNNDPLLAQIIQTATELQNDLHQRSTLNNAADLERGAMSFIQQQQQQTAVAASVATSVAQQVQQQMVSMSKQQLLRPMPPATVATSKANSMTDDATLLSQLDQVLNSSNISLSEIDNLLGIAQSNAQYNTQDMPEQMAIDVIQQQLMQDDPSLGGNASLKTTIDQSAMAAKNKLNPNTNISKMNVLNSMTFNLQGSGNNNGNNAAILNSTSLDSLLAMDSSGGPQSLESMLTGGSTGFSQQQQQQQQTNVQMIKQPNNPSFNLAVRFPNQNQQGLNNLQQQAAVAQQQAAAAAAVVQQQQQNRLGNFSGMSQANVRHSLLLQHRQRQMRDIQKRKRLQQEHQRLLLQQQQQQINQFGQQPGFPRGFVENFGELMNAGVVPNVSLQPNQVGPLSPMYSQGNVAGQVSPAQMSPAQMSQFSPQSQWNRNTSQQSSMMQGNQFANQLQRSHSMPTSNQGNFVGDNFVATPTNQGMFPSPGQQQKQSYPQQQQTPRGVLVRQMSTPNHGNTARVGGPQSPYTSSPVTDPLLMSPQKVSAQQQQQQQQQQQSNRGNNNNNNNVPQPQISPSGGLTMGQNLANAAAQNFALTSTMTSQTMTSGGTIQQFDQNIGAFTTNIPTPATEQIHNYSNKGAQHLHHHHQHHMPPHGGGAGPIPGSTPQQPMLYAGHYVKQQQQQQQVTSQQQQVQQQGMVISGNVAGNSASQYVKQELRNICNARSQVQQQQQPTPAQQQQQADSLQNTDEFPMELLYQIDEFTREQLGTVGNTMQAQTDAMMQQQQVPQQVMNASVSIQPEIAVQQARQEAKRRYERFRALSIGSQSEVIEEPKIKASNLFRNQLLTQQGQMKPDMGAACTSSTAPGQMTALNQSGSKTKIDPSSIQVVQTEPRTPVEDMQPPDTSNSLLQQLLSE
ncbi:uncharacterized protein LOC141910208 isoform X3 [Tubulanus polymorphus]|uniref:uncharacterized protein LOC141910208 isoform X3 n=1 Tax=Tubulanus polymorphus TaxID=672921 RepID=UPI003DA6A9E6